MKGHFGVSLLAPAKESVSHRAKVPGRRGRECQRESARPLQRPPLGECCRAGQFAMQTVMCASGPSWSANSTGLTLVLTLTPPTPPRLRC